MSTGGALYLAYRPQAFDEVVGNADMLASLQSVLARTSDKLPHTFLLTGPSGCGKTTIARIIATELGCAVSEYTEVNAADFNGVNTVREINQQMRLSPLSGDIKVYVIDECHKLTDAAQNAFLKSLEDTPSHVFFILCTTDPQKLLKTVVTRCTQFSVSSIQPVEMVGFLKEILEAEGVSDFPEDVLKLIAKNSLGSPRMALVLLDKVIDMVDGDLAAVVEKAASEESTTIELCKLLISERVVWKKVADVLAKLDADVESVRHSVLGYMTAVLLNKESDRAALVIECFQEPFYNSGKAGLVKACYDVFLGAK